jgi:hypothetical protein
MQSTLKQFLTRDTRGILCDPSIENFESLFSQGGPSFVAKGRGHVETLDEFGMIAVIVVLEVSFLY